MPPLPDVPPLGRVTLGLVCEIADDAQRVPSCDALAALFRRVRRPAATFGIIVSRHSSERSECQGAWNAAGRHVSDLPAVD